MDWQAVDDIPLDVAFPSIKLNLGSPQSSQDRSLNIRTVALGFLAFIRRKY